MDSGRISAASRSKTDFSRWPTADGPSRLGPGPGRRHRGCDRYHASGDAGGRHSSRPPTQTACGPRPDPVLADSGIVVLGGVNQGRRTRLTRRRAPPRRPTITGRVRPIRDWLFPVLNVSQNWIAEMLLKQLGRQIRGGGIVARRIGVERRFLIDSSGRLRPSLRSRTAPACPPKRGESADLCPAMPSCGSNPNSLPFGRHPAERLDRLAPHPLSHDAGRRTGPAKTGSIGQVNTFSGTSAAPPRAAALPDLQCPGDQPHPRRTNAMISGHRQRGRRNRTRRRARQDGDRAGGILRAFPMERRHVKIYTRTGDKGRPDSSAVAGSKAHPRVPPMATWTS